MVIPIAVLEERTRAELHCIQEHLSSFTGRVSIEGWGRAFDEQLATFRAIEAEWKGKLVDLKIRQNRADEDLIFGSKHGCTLILQQCLDLGANVNYCDSNNSAALHYAAQAGNAKIVDTLLANGAYVNIRDDREWTPLHKACVNTKVSIVRSLLRAGANEGARDRWGATPEKVYLSYGRFQQEIRHLLQRAAERRSWMWVAVLHNRTKQQEATGGRLKVARRSARLQEKRMTTEAVNAVDFMVYRAPDLVFSMIFGFL